MAFGFFRRRQKMVVIIMAILMVSFLVGLQGMRMLLYTPPEKQVIGTTSEGDLRNSDLWSGGTDLEILMALGLDRLLDDFALLLQQPRRDLTYALLLKEADGAGGRVAAEDVDHFLQQIGLTGENYKGVMSHLRTDRGFPEDRVRTALADWLQIHRFMARVMVNAPPSEQEVLHAVRNEAEKVRLRVLRIPAGKFLEKPPEPTEAQLRQQFEAYRAVGEGTYPAANSFGFGYRTPKQVRIVYLLIRRDVIQRIAKPKEDRILEYYNEYKSEFVKEDGSQKTAAEAWDQIEKGLSSGVAKEQVERIVRRVTQLQAEYDQNPGATLAASAFEYAARKMTISPGQVKTILDRKVTVRIDKVAMDEAIATLAGQAELNAIYYPYGEDGSESLDPNVRVTLRGEMTLSGALQEISRQAQWPTTSWGMCEGFEKVLFPLGESGFPILAEDSGSLARRELQEHEVLGVSFSDAFQTVAQLAFTVAPLAEAKEQTPEMLKLGQDGPRMFVCRDKGQLALWQWAVSQRPDRRDMLLPRLEQDLKGLLLWRVAEARPDRVPTEMTEEITERVKRDLNTVAGFAQAYEAARKIDSAEKFEQAVEKGDFESVETEMLSRQEILSLGVPLSFLDPPPGRTMPSQIRQQIRKAFLDLAFSTELLPPSADPPYPDKSESLVVKRLEPNAEVLVFRRIGYAPLVRDLYVASRSNGLKILQGRRRFAAANFWYQAVQQRIQFRAKQP
ncbi:MAG TPA: hypothetical protein VMZ50_03495 [Phycisphaerae bacterium]|nr:hypothetical protein [Phycisphaerae bacterium]